jgi:glycosyltransferase involved in cell wall biosynthesis
VPELSLVVPAYRQSATIEADLTRLHAVLNQLTAGSFELIVVVDGFVDDTLERAKAIALPHIAVTGYATNVGKGHAVRYGMQCATGTFVGFIDAGMDIDPSAIGPALTAMRIGADVAVGSKLHPAARTMYPPVRRIYSKGYQILIWLLFRLSIRDTQVGLKVFRGDLLRPVVTRLLVKRFAFDVELLVALTRTQTPLHIVEVPVRIERPTYFQSSVNVDAVRHVFLDTLAIWYRANVRRTYG